jgi:hypothetical protein
VNPILSVCSGADVPTSRAHPSLSFSVGAAGGLSVSSSKQVDLNTVATFSPRASAGLDVAVGPVRVGIEGTVADIQNYNMHVGARLQDSPQKRRLKPTLRRLAHLGTA